GLDEGRFVGLGTEHAQERRRMEGAGADLDVDRLVQHAAVVSPESLELQDHLLQVHDPNRWYRDGRARERELPGPGGLKMRGTVTERSIAVKMASSPKPLTLSHATRARRPAGAGPRARSAP